MINGKVGGGGYVSPRQSAGALANIGTMNKGKLVTEDGTQVTNITIKKDGNGFTASCPGTNDSGQFLNALQKAGYGDFGSTLKFDEKKGEWTVRCGSYNPPSKSGIINNETLKSDDGTNIPNVTVVKDGDNFLASAPSSADSGQLLNALMKKGYSNLKITAEGDKWLVRCDYSPSTPAAKGAAFASAPATASNVADIGTGQPLPQSGVVRLSINDPRLNVGQIPVTFTSGPLKGWSPVKGAGDGTHVVLEKAPPSTAAFSSAPATSAVVERGKLIPPSPPMADGTYTVNIGGTPAVFHKIDGVWYVTADEGFRAGDARKKEGITSSATRGSRNIMDKTTGKEKTYYPVEIDLGRAANHYPNLDTYITVQLGHKGVY